MPISSSRFFLLFLFIWSILNLLFVTLTLISSQFRYMITKHTMPRTLDSRTLYAVLEGATYSDWLLMTRLSDNLYSSGYANLFKIMCKELLGQQQHQNGNNYQLKSLDLTQKGNRITNNVHHDGENHPGPQPQTEVFFAHL